MKRIAVRAAARYAGTDVTPIRSTLAALAVCIAALFIAAPGTAAAWVVPTRYCGNWGGHADGHVGWGMSGVTGAGIFNVTTHQVRCRRARRLVRRYRGTDTRHRAWECREINHFQFSDIRCTASRRRVIHWQTGA